MEVATKVGHQYSVSLKWDNESQNGVAIAGKRMPILFAPPPEFGGTDKLWSPEHLLAASLSSCYATTFFYFSKLLKVDVRSFHLEVIMEVEKDVTGIFTATRFTLRPHIEFGIKQGQAMINNLLSKAKRYCIISNSVKGEIVVLPEMMQ
jgi:organic hydroperoxide reductase OsmC/OhrA